MKPKIGKDNEVTLFYPNKRTIRLKDMTTELAYKLDGIPKDRNSRFTTKYLNLLQDGKVDDSAKWSVADRILTVLLYGVQQNAEVNQGGELKAKFNYPKPCRYCGKVHGFSFNYAKLLNNYKNVPKAWPVIKWKSKDIELKPITGDFETLMEFQESQYWKKELIDSEPGTLEYQNDLDDLKEHNSNVFSEVQFLIVSAHTGIDVDKLKVLKIDKFRDLLSQVQKHRKDLNYGIQFWKDEGDHIRYPGRIEYYHRCIEPDEDYMAKIDPALLERYKKGGLEAILITIPFRAEHCT